MSGNSQIKQKVLWRIEKQAIDKSRRTPGKKLLPGTDDKIIIIL